MNGVLALLDALRLALAAVVVAWAAWWSFLAFVATLPRRPRRSRALAGWRWAVVVPAHNEESLIGATVDSLREAGSHLPVPPLLLVVADNCDDRTAEVAREHGASVLERHDRARRGKGYALEFAVAHLSADAPDAVAFVDADTLVSSTFLAASQRALQDGARVTQAYYQVMAEEDRETALLGLRRLAFMLVHWARPMGLQRLGLGSGLKGNGMAFRWAEVAGGLGSEGIAEDAAMTLTLAERAVHVAFVPDAEVRGMMAGSYQDAQVQDDRWERGRLGLAPRALRIGVTSMLRGRLAASAAAFEVAAPPLSMLAALSMALAGTLPLHRGGSPLLVLLAPASIVGYVVLGLRSAGASRTDLAALRGAPRFALHKASIFARALRRRDQAWQRTARPVRPR